jgi:hydrogenase maturation protease
VLVAGIGHPDRGDDAAGLLVARGVRAAGTGVCVVESRGDLGELIEAWDGARLAVIVDAARAATSPGRIHRLTDVALIGTRPAVTSSHGLGLGETLALATALGRLPEQLVVYALASGPRGHRAHRGTGPRGSGCPVPVCRRRHHGQGQTERFQ